MGSKDKPRSWLCAAPSCLTLCNPADCSRQASQYMGFSSQENWRGCHALLQAIFLTQESNLHLLDLLHCRWILYC